ncbi:unnamed protein product [Miscanthus lutarioriparius]|uniref:Uncharacterized protein n=1 Tax=Miscanthus lutarioriparius TaxID=422564 RepID=A0A811PQK0_9POAL|nr:unnamed protein product [Miscanthus lutarioriparius]
MANLAAQLKNKFFGLVGRITSCGRSGATHKDAADSSVVFCSWCDGDQVSDISGLSSTLISATYVGVTQSA